MNRLSSFVAILVLSACSPQNAELTSGSYTMFLSKNTSTVVSQGKVDLDNFENTWNIDCRNLADEDLRLSDPLDVCHGFNDLVGTADRSVNHEGWVNLDAFHVVHETLDPWRGEAIMTSEGDLQLIFHNRLNGGQDMRFAIVVDPNFRPRVCEQTDDGVVWADVDGDWMANWSNQLGHENFPGEGDSGTLIPLNSGAYQFNPNPTSDSEPWYFPDEWAAGYSQARWASEIMYMRTTRYGKPSAYSSFEDDEADLNEETDLFYISLEEGVDGDSVPAYDEMMGTVALIATQSEEEMGWFYPDSVESANHSPIVIDNGWRVSDGRNAGLDGWGELHYNWVRLDQAAADIGVGAPVSGEFRLFYKGVDSGSRMVIEGQFNVDSIHKDTWSVEELAPQKYEENQTVLCGEPAYSEQ
jgi:hypothetical protein